MEISHSLGHSPSNGMTTDRTEGSKYGGRHRRNNEKTSSAKDQDRWKLDLLTALQENNWGPKNKDDMDKFSYQLHSSVQIDIEARFCKPILTRLYFSDLPDRIQHIPKAHQETFEWILNPRDSDAETARWDSLMDWLQSTNDNNPYWITGKPGSGKSTLMKHLFHDSRTSAYLGRWSGEHDLIKAGFFFWNSGTPMQMSRMGLLQSILHQALSYDRSLIRKVFNRRWDELTVFGGGRHAFTWSELRAAFETLISQTSTNFFFCIDGLDEFDGKSSELIELILDAAKYHNVKICVSSRPWPIFEDSFGSLSSLLLERLTHNDINNYVISKFNDNKYFVRLRTREPDRASRLVSNVVDKAAGVFLWVYVVVSELLDGLSNADRMSDLQTRLDSLPPDLEVLFNKLLEDLEPIYFTHACQLFRLILVHEQPHLLLLSFADEENTKSAMSAEIKPLTNDDVLDRLDIMERRLVAHCKCFLEVYDSWKNPNKVASSKCRLCRGNVERC
jgi:hypothetical protein